MSFHKLSNDTLVSAISVLVKKTFTKNSSNVHYFLTDFDMVEEVRDPLSYSVSEVSPKGFFSLPHSLNAAFCPKRCTSKAFESLKLITRKATVGSNGTIQIQKPCIIFHILPL